MTEELLKAVIYGLIAIIGAGGTFIVTGINYQKRKYEKDTAVREQKHEAKVKDLTNGGRLSLQGNQQRLEEKVTKLDVKVDKLLARQIEGKRD